MTIDRKVTIHDVARRAGVSISSVSRALSDHPHVSDNLRARVEAAVQELNYQRDFLGHSLRRGRTNSVGFLVGNLSNPVIADISDGAAEVLAAREYAMTLVCSQNDPDQDVAYLRFLTHRQVDGLIVSSAANGPGTLPSLIAELGIPTVMLDRELVEAPHVSAVQSDHVSGMQAAVNHLLAQGHRRIALIGGPEFFFPARRRLAGFRLAYEGSDLPLDAALLRAVGMDTQAAYAESLRLLALPDPPTAFIAGGNLILVGILQALQERNIVVGRDLALIGCDDTALAQLYKPAITVIARNLRLLGETAAQLLTETIEQAGGKVVILPTNLVVRDSSRVGPSI